MHHHYHLAVQRVRAARAQATDPAKPRLLADEITTTEAPVDLASNRERTRVDLLLQGSAEFHSVRSPDSKVLAKSQSPKLKVAAELIVSEVRDEPPGGINE